MESEHKRLLGTALSMHQVGNLDEALNFYQQALNLNPEHSETILFTAVAYCQKNEYHTAKTFFEKLDPDNISTNPNYFINYGLTLSELDELDKAIELLKKGIELDSEALEAYFNLGRCYYKMQNYAEASKYFTDVLKHSPDDIQALSYMGAICIELEKIDEGLNLLEKAFSLGGESSFIRYSTGSAFEKQEHLSEAEKQYERAIELDNKNVGAHLGLGRIYAKQGEYAKAAEKINATRLISDNKVEEIIECNLSTIAHLQGNNEDAEIHAQKALELNPSLPEANGLLALAYSNTNRQIDAIKFFKNAIEVKNPNIMHLINMSKNYAAIGMTEDAIAVAQKAFELDMTSADAFSSLLLYLHYPSNIAKSDISSLHKQFGEVFSNKLLNEENELQSIQKIKPKIGFISGDFGVHSIQFFFEPLLKEISEAAELETILFSNTSKKDQVTRQYIDYATKFIDIRHLSDIDAYNVIQSENLDALIDLSGHTNGNRLKLLAMKPAAKQLTYLGYPNTTGLKEIDYRLTDAIADPEGNDEQYSETLYRFDDCFLTYLPPEHPEAKVRNSENIVFGSFNNIAKLSEETLSSWAEILKQVENSTLLIKCHGLVEDDLSLLLTPKLVNLGIEENRVKYASRQSNFSEHLNLYNQIDIALDTFPYNGTTTSFEALLMGRPLITRFSDTHVSSVGKSILTALDEEDLITNSREDYIIKAVNLANDRKKINDYHNSLSNKLSSSKLCNNKLFYKKFIEALKKMQII